MKNYFDKTKEELIKEIELLRKQIQSNFSNCHLGITDKENPSFLNVMENTPLSIIIFNDEQIYFTNKAFQELTEYNQHEIDKMKFSDFTYSEDRHILEEEIIKCNLSQINSINTEIRITTHNKKNKWIELIANKINYNNKEVIFSIAVDITEKNEILDQKNILNDQLSFTIKSIVEGVITTNAEGKIVMMNNTAEILTEWNSDDALGRNINDVFCLVNEKKEEKNHISIKDMIDSKKIFNNAISTKLISKNKKKRVIQYYLAPISDNKQNVCGGIIIFKDRSEQKILEEQLKEIEEVYNTLFEAAPDAILIMQDDKFVNCNNKTLAIFQCTKEQIIGKPPFYFSPEYQPDGRPSKIVAWEKISLAQSGIPQAFEWKHTRYNRTDFDAEVVLHNIIIQGQLYLQAIVKDVTEQKNVQKNLKKSEEMFRLFFKSTSQSITINNAVTNEKGELIDAIIIEANPAFGNMTGIEYKKAAGMKLSEVNPFVYKELLKGYEESLKINYPNRFDFYSKFSNKFNEFIIYGIKKDQFAIICSDITERKREEETKRLNEARLSSLIELSNMTNKSHDEITDFVLNEAIKLTGSKYGYIAFISPDEKTIQMHTWSSGIIKNFPNNNTKITIDIEKVGLLAEPIRNKKPYIENDYPSNKFKKNNLFTGHIELKKFLNVPIFDKEHIVILSGVANKETNYEEADIQQLTLLLSGMWQILQRKKNEDALLKSEEQYRFISNNSNDIIVRTDTNGIVKFISASCKNLLGFEPEEITGKNSIGFVHMEDLTNINNYEKEILAKSAPNLIRHRVQKADGNYIWLETNNQIVYETDGKIKEVLSVCRDITEMLQSEKLIKEKEEAELSNKTKSEFLANISHEIRNPLNSIIGLTNTLSRTNKSEANIEYIEYIKIASNNLLNILNDILDFSKIEANKVEIINSNFELEKLIMEVYSIFKPIAEHKKIDIQYKIEKDIPDLLYGDVNKFKQIIINLISNAVKYTDIGFIKINVQIAKKLNDQFIIQVDIADSGIGIKKQDYTKLFMSFTQLDSSITKSFSGTGLGLAIVKSYVDLLKGEVSFTSEYGKGSVFTIRIPFTLPSTIQSEMSFPISETKKIKTSLHVLIAEDDGINQLYLKNFLKNKGLTVDAVFNGLQAIEKYNEGMYDLILMDGQMPKMDGMQATLKIREIEKTTNKHTPIIAITGYAVTGDKEKFLSNGFDDYISKPIDETRLSEIIDKYGIKKEKTNK